MPLNVSVFEASKLVSTKTPITKALLPPSRSISLETTLFGHMGPEGPGRLLFWGGGDFFLFKMFF